MRRALVTLAVLSGLVAVISCSETASASISCNTTRVIGVRGSGQLYAESQELNAIKNLLPSVATFTELDNKIDFLIDEPAYRAIKVAEGGKPTKDGFIAWVSRSELGEYTKSVNSGKNLLEKYIESFRSTSTCLVLVGYSQGAQVVNETVREMHKADPTSLKNVIYIGLLGDPLYNPFGFDAPNKPSWLRGSALYPFYGVLYKDVGLPGVEQPDYIPRNPSNSKVPFTKIGSWCNYGDVICATDVEHHIAMRDGHSTYIDDGIPEMVEEIKAAVANPDQNITNAIYPQSTCGAAKQDMAVLLDTSAYMRRNSDVFTDQKNTWDTKLIAGTTNKAFRTFGEQMLDSGCADKRIAIVGFEGTSGQAPRVLLDFTNNPDDIDVLMKSLYQPSAGGVAERPLVREAAILAMQQNWRSDASRTLYVISTMAGAGPATATWRDTWATPSVVDSHMSDEVGQRFLSLSRQTRTSLIASLALPIDMTGFTWTNTYPGDANAYPYYQVLSQLTGGYNWSKTFIAYPIKQLVRNVNFAEEIRQFEVRRDGTKIGMGSVKAQVGKPVTLSLNDQIDLLASARLRNNGTATDWYLDCGVLHKPYSAPKLPDGGIVFTPTKAGTCTAAVRVSVQANGNGCYSGCPEPFPPYMSRVVPFRLEVMPADYVEETPGNITTLRKVIFDDRVEFSWSRPIYQGDDLAYLVKDNEGSVLGVTTTTKTVVTDTDKQDADIIVQAVGSGGRSADLSSLNEGVAIIDSRTVASQPEPEKPPSPDPELPDPEEEEFIAPPGQETSNNEESETISQPVTLENVISRATGEITRMSESEPIVTSELVAQTLGDSVVQVAQPEVISLKHTIPVGDKEVGGGWWWKIPIVIASAVLALWVKAAIVRR